MEYTLVRIETGKRERERERGGREGGREGERERGGGREGERGGREEGEGGREGGREGEHDHMIILTLNFNFCNKVNKIIVIHTLFTHQPTCTCI